ncbi:MAG: hypothetical protein HGB36_13080 [Chlorobiaceae bacterium]|nr:hypothetical protein [Chlorobiaceae bacterium]
MSAIQFATDEPGLDALVEKYPDVPKSIILKLDLQRRGISFTEATSEATNQPYYRGPEQTAFSNRDTRPHPFPGPLLLRDGTSVLASPVPNQFNDPYSIDYQEGKFFIFDKGVRIDEVDFSPRPLFYGKLTSRGVPMESIAWSRPQRLDIYPYRYCHYWDTRDQCKFCAFFTDLKQQKQLAGDSYAKIVDPEDIYETVREAIKEPGRFSQINLTAGTDYSGEVPFEREVDRYIKVLQAIGRNFRTRRFPSQLIAPAYTKKQVKRLHEETGLSSYCPDIEVWDKELFKWICSGKEKWFGRDYWIRSAIDAVEIFGKGNVYTNFVAGVEFAQPHGFKSVDEALESNFEACEFFAKHGVVYLSLVWVPWKGTGLGGQKQPPLEYYVRLVRGLVDIRRHYGLASDNDDFKHCGNHGDSDLERLN